jgi:hypothetical protein
VTEWTAYSKVWPRDVYVTHLKELLAWFEDLKYKFWRLGNQNGQNCFKKPFVQMSKAELLELTDDLFRRNIFIDIVIAPGTLDPNSL